MLYPNMHAPGGSRSDEINSTKREVFLILIFSFTFKLLCSFKNIFQAKQEFLLKLLNLFCVCGKIVNFLFYNLLVIIRGIVSFNQRSTSSVNLIFQEFEDSKIKRIKVTKLF